MKIKTERFLIVLEENAVKLTPLSDLLVLKGSLKIPWSVEEFEETAGNFYRRELKDRERQK